LYGVRSFQLHSISANSGASGIGFLEISVLHRPIRGFRIERVTLISRDVKLMSSHLSAPMHEQIELNEHHRRRLLVSCQYIDRLLASIENAAAAGTSLSPFPKYVQDLTPREQKEMREQVAKLRAQLLSFLKRRDIAIPGPTISARHSIVTSLGYIDIAVEELKPRYLGGYGRVPSALVPELTRAVEELQASVKAAISEIKGTATGDNGQETSAS
jgi:hypothetical protein